VTGMLTLAEDADFYFDADAGERPVRFIERYCRHYEGAFAGEPFKLHPLQRRIITDLFGWKWRSTGLRRFTDCYFEAAVGAGKSPLLAALGLYALMADGEAGAQVYSLASNYGQARVVFECAKRFSLADPELERRLDVIDREIRHKASGSFWRIVSGKGPGAGCRPSFVAADECHEWSGPGAYQALRDRMSKRRQPLFITATNAGQSRVSFCWQLREKAVAALEGRGDSGMYPVILAAPEDARTDDPEAWRQANPLIGVTIQEDKVARLATEAMKDPVEEDNCRRLYLSHWPKAGAGRWLDMGQWDAATGALDPHDLMDALLYVGFDLSQVDDLSAVIYTYVTPDRLYVDAHFYMPRVTGENYQSKYAIPYLDWADAGHITLLDTPTISQSARRRIAADIIARTKGRTVKAVCYDRYKADDTVATLEAAGLTCVPVAQGYSVAPGAQELERRIKEGSIRIAENPVLRFCAENTEVKADDRGNYWPCKPNAKGRYAGERARKIDGVSALVTALTEARKHSFPVAQKLWKGEVCIA
jgi:phage terminase large subunit-like protein